MMIGSVASGAVGSRGFDEPDRQVVHLAEPMGNRDHRV
jgi:hypothetical protein